ncbi:hypothetical protein ACGF8D_34675 [Streptomyces massasporeus]|uniref:hypothetical protein n=1 Tax=Streptomyces massasporeus TaxID=67324 RepID=UPI003721821C
MGGTSVDDRGATHAVGGMRGPPTGADAGDDTGHSPHLSHSGKVAGVIAEAVART